MKRTIACMLAISCLLLAGCAPKIDASEPSASQGVTIHRSGGQVYDIPEGYELVAGLFFRDGSFYAFDSGDLTPVETAAFTGTVPELGWPLGFSWCAYDGEIILADIRTDDRCTVEAIPGCTRAVLCRMETDQPECGRYALCALDTGAVEWLFPEVLEDYDIRLLEVSPDMNRVVFTTDAGVYACDGQVTDLASASGAPTGRRLGIRFVGEDVLLTAIDAETLEFQVSCYLCSGGQWRQTVSDMPLYVQGYKEEGLQFHRTQATFVKNGDLWALDLRTGVQTDTGLSADGLYHVTETRDGWLTALAEDGLATVLLDGGTVMVQVKTGLTPDQGASCFTCGDTLELVYLQDSGVCLYQIPVA